MSTAILLGQELSEAVASPLPIAAAETWSVFSVVGGIVVPSGYVSGSLSGTATYNNQTFANLGLASGTYVWTWGTGADADSLTLQIGPAAAVPEPPSLPLLAMGLVGLGLVLRTRRA
jgi:hypothetical protein